jgi:putative transposase
MARRRAGLGAGQIIIADVTDTITHFHYPVSMPSRLKRYQDTQRDSHFITFSCYKRQAFLSNPYERNLCQSAIEQFRVQYEFTVIAYVIMPEHVHLLVSEAKSGPLASAIQAIKQSVSRRLIGNRDHFWQERYYDFNVWSLPKQKEKVRYIHRNPVRRGLVDRPEEWLWSSFRNYLTGEPGVVEVETSWVEYRREELLRTITPPYGSLREP